MLLGSSSYSSEMFDETAVSNICSRFSLDTNLTNSIVMQFFVKQIVHMALNKSSSLSYPLQCAISTNRHCKTERTWKKVSIIYNREVPWSTSRKKNIFSNHSYITLLVWDLWNIYMVITFCWNSLLFRVLHYKAFMFKNNKSIMNFKK